MPHQSALDALPHARLDGQRSQVEPVELRQVKNGLPMLRVGRHQGLLLLQPRAIVPAMNVLHRAILPDPLVNEFGPMRTLLVVLAEKIRALSPEPDITRVMEAVQVCIETTLDTGLPDVYTREVYEDKCAAVFQHVYES